MGNESGLRISMKVSLITSIEDPNFHNDTIDTVVWVSKNGEKVNFSVKTATIDLCTDVPKVCWWGDWFAIHNISLSTHSFSGWPYKID